MAEASQGLKHYLLILISSLINDLEDCGPKCAAAAPGLNEHDVNRAFFLARRLRPRLPESPNAVASDEIWLEIVGVATAIRAVLDAQGERKYESVVAEAQRKTSEAAQADIQRAFEQKRAAGEIDFRLHGLSKGRPGNADTGRVDRAVHESFLIKRSGRYLALLDFDDLSLKIEEQLIARDAKIMAQRIAEAGYTDRRIDALLAMATVLMKTACVRLNPEIPEAIKAKFDLMARNAAMALGAIVYRDEYEQLKLSVGPE